MTPMQWYSIEKYRSGTIKEALRSRDLGFGVEGHRHGVTVDGAEADK